MAFTTIFQTLCSSLYLLSILSPLFFYPSSGTVIGYTTHLIPYDSPLSPFHNPKNTHFDRLHDAFKRSFERANHFRSSIQSPMKPGGGEYLMKMSLGTPPIEIIGIVDTGSDLIWTQCLPCIICYNQTIPLFDTSHSSSYKTIPCQSSFCQAIPNQYCNKNNTCGYRIAYGDGSFSSGNLSSETLTLGTSSSSLSVQNIAFGCSDDTDGLFDKSGSGIIGLGSGKLSLISQTSQSFGKKFSYCLVPSSINSTSKISFGNNSVVSGPGFVTTPIVTKGDETFYYLSLEAVSVGIERIAYKGETKNGVVEGNIIVDSGTTLTILPDSMFNAMVKVLDRVIGLEKVDDPDGQLDACYKSVGDKINIKLPIITMHFKGGDVKLKPVNTFLWVNNDVVCLTMVPNTDLAIYGNLAQMNFLVGFDLNAGTVSFKPTDCTKE
ncbi:Xylanase inhibitor, C-terminal [Sesbania bispinosa]|nr:Xylanase inhibitor, C-terminal [Sesbania bispinosa]